MYSLVVNHLSRASPSDAQARTELIGGVLAAACVVVSALGRRLDETGAVEGGSLDVAGGEQVFAPARSMAPRSRRYVTSSASSLSPRAAVAEAEDVAANAKRVAARAALYERTSHTHVEGEKARREKTAALATAMAHSGAAGAAAQLAAA